MKTLADHTAALEKPESYPAKYGLKFYPNITFKGPGTYLS